MSKLHEAAWSNDVDTIDHLLNAGGNPNERSAHEERAGDATAGVILPIITLISIIPIKLMGASPTDIFRESKYLRVNKRGWTPLHYAALKGNFNAAERLLADARTDVNQQGSDGKTPLHIALEIMSTELALDGENKTYQQAVELCGLLLHKNADATALIVIEDYKVKDAIIRARDNYAAKIRQVVVPLPTKDVLTVASIGDNGVDKIQYISNVYEQLLRIPEIVPVFEIVALATQGRHEIGAMVNGKKEKLRITIDFTSEVVENITLGDVNNAWGVYYNRANLPNRNRLYVGGKRQDNETQGTLAHELTHFVAEEVYKNNCRPYCAYDKVNKERFTAICDELISRKHTLHWALSSAFLENYLRNDQCHSELIVKIPQILAAYGTENGLKILNEQAPRLLQYYREIFQPDCLRHINSLRSPNKLYNKFAYISEASPPDLHQLMLKYNSLGITAYAQNKFDEALNYFGTSISIKPNAQVWHNIGMTAFCLSRFKEALDCYNEALKLDPTHASTLNEKPKVLAKIAANNAQANPNAFWQPAPAVQPANSSAQALNARIL